MSLAKYSAVLAASITLVGLSTSFGATLPTGIPGGQALWLAADSGVTTDANNNLTHWVDASGNNFDWLGANGVNAGGVTLVQNQNTTAIASGNHVPVVNFADNGPGGLSLNQTGRKLDLSSFSVYIVANTTPFSATAPQDFITNFSGGAGYAVGTADGDTTNAKFYTGSGGTNINTSNGSFAGSKFNLLVATIDDSANKTLTAAPYGTAPSTATGNGENLTTSGEYVMGNLPGGSQPLSGNIAEMLIYNDAGLTDAQIATQAADVGAYLDAKYFATPEPASIGLLGLGALGLLARRRRA